MTTPTSEEKEYYDLTKRAFNFLAPFYNVMTLPLVRVRDQVAEFANADKASTILDVATGTGQQAFAFAKLGCDVTAIDLTQAMLDIARKNARNGLVKFEIADATQLQFETNSFDITCVSFALHDMPLMIREKVLKEMMRVTKANGVIVIADYDLPSNTIGRVLIYHLVSLYECKYYKEFIATDLESLLRKIGVEAVEKVYVLHGAGSIVKGVKKV